MCKKADKVKIQCLFFHSVTRFTISKNIRFAKNESFISYETYGKCQQQISSSVIRKQIDFGHRRNQVIT